MSTAISPPPHDPKTDPRNAQCRTANLGMCLCPTAVEAISHPDLDLSVYPETWRPYVAHCASKVIAEKAAWMPGVQHVIANGGGAHAPEPERREPDLRVRGGSERDIEVEAGMSNLLRSLSHLLRPALRAGSSAVSADLCRTECGRCPHLERTYRCECKEDGTKRRNVE